LTTYTSSFGGVVASSKVHMINMPKALKKDDIFAKLSEPAISTLSVSLAGAASLGKFI
jgi:hypothetical protein